MPEYSKGPEILRGASGALTASLPAIVAGAAALGALLLLAAEPATLYSIHVATRRAAVETTTTGAHQSYALVPIALLMLALAAGSLRSWSRPVLLAIGGLGGVALLIALLGDLPDANSTGVLGSFATGVQPASSTPGLGLYLETLGAVLVLVAGASGMFLTSSGRRRSQEPSRRSRNRSGSQPARS